MLRIIGTSTENVKAVLSLIIYITKDIKTRQMSGVMIWQMFVMTYLD